MSARLLLAALAATLAACVPAAREAESTANQRDVVKFVTRDGNTVPDGPATRTN